MNQQYIQVISRLLTLKPRFLQSPHRLTKLKSILGHFGHPEASPHKYVHVGGTNGKGSVSMKIAKGLQLSGFKTGLFTSPHLFSYTERIKINSKPIPPQRFLQTYYKVSPYIDEHQLNYFEVATLMAFVYYRDENCDKVVLEVGVGGWIDATNVIESPIVSVVTSIGLDHIEILGDSLHSIAKNKAGIIKEGRPIVIGVNCFPESVFEQKAKQMNSNLYRAEGSHKSFEEEHNALVTKAFDVIQSEEGITITPQAREQVLKARQQCRRQYILQERLPVANQQKRNKVVLDVGHNPPALKRLFETLREEHPSNRFVIIYGTSGHKDSASTTKIIRQFSDSIYLIQAKHFRAMALSQLKRNAMGIQGIQVVAGGDIPKTIQHVLEEAKEDDIIVICGSFFIMGEVKGFFYPEQIRSRLDPPVIQLN